MSKARDERVRAILHAVGSEGDEGATREPLLRWIMANLSVGSDGGKKLLGDLEFVGWLDQDGIRYRITESGEAKLRALDGGARTRTGASSSLS